LFIPSRFVQDEKKLQDYHLKDGVKLHIVLKKQTTSGQQHPVPKQPKYQPNDFWIKLNEVLSHQYDNETVKDIITHFKRVSD